MIHTAGLRSLSLGILSIILLGGAPPASTGQVLETYRARHRPARELVPVAEAALGDQGRVTLDPRTGTLILNGTDAAVRRALSLLEEIDRPLHQLVLNYEVRRLSELEQAGVHVQWKVAGGSVRVGLAAAK
jgi:type II secretory pathway component GspD/PulD (secretin)